MKVTDVSTLMNDLVSNLLGTQSTTTAGNEDDAVTTVDAYSIGDLVQMGQSLPDSTSVDNFFGKMLDRIITTLVTNRPYNTYVDDYVITAEEFGAIIQKLTVAVGDYELSDTWNLKEGDSVDMYKVHKPLVIQKLYDGINAWELDVTLVDRQIRSAFKDEAGLKAFIAGYQTDVQNSLQAAKEAAFHACVSNYILERVSDGNNATVKKVNLLHEYNTLTNRSLTVDSALLDKDFLRYAAGQIKMWSDRMTKVSTNFNDAGDGVKLRKHTSRDMQRLLLNSEFATNMEYHMQADTYHADMVKLIDYTAIPSWQSQDSNYTFKSTSLVQKLNADGEVVKQTGVVGFLFDRDALGITVKNERVTSSPFNAKGEYYNYFNKADIGYFNDMSEQSVVFVMEEV